MRGQSLTVSSTNQNKDKCSHKHMSGKWWFFNLTDRLPSLITGEFFWFVMSHFITIGQNAST